ncbi:AaceriADR105Wp [[Ashbya] aceris (nom. inval.)]|nr:AaceriADR105Wp [[Ashbya] aceris (nom. inval.)]
MPAGANREDEEQSVAAKSGSASRKVQKRPSLTQLNARRAEEDLVRATSLNAYSLKPTTVPPFALDAQFKRLRVRDSLGVSGEMLANGGQRFKDPFLVSYDSQWSEFVNVIDAEGGHGKRHKSSLGAHSHSTFSSTDSSGSSPLKNEKLRAIMEQSPTRRGSSQSILTDLESNWGGEERLNAIFEAPILHDYEFKDQKDRNEWTKYISQLKHFYYGSIFKSGGSSRGGSNSESDDDDEVGRIQAFVERHKLEFRRKKLYWLQFEQRKKQQWGPQMRRLLLDSQYLPLSFRLIIIMLTCVALGLAVRIFQNSHNRIEDTSPLTVPQQPSTIMAIVVNTVAIVYLAYIAYDEFAGKPLGLRNPIGKMRLILLDLLFIIFSSANLSLAFNTLYDKTWVCTGLEESPNRIPKIDYICRKQRALSAFLFLVVVMWVITFTISILRVVERVSSLSPR